MEESLKNSPSFRDPEELTPDKTGTDTQKHIAKMVLHGSSWGIVALRDQQELLTHDETNEIFAKMRDLESVSVELAADNSDGKHDERLAENEFFRENLRNELIERNMKLIWWSAKRYYNFAKTRDNLADHDDLFEAGVEGIMKAIDKFDPAGGAEFTTYATLWIRQAVARHVNDSGTIRKPVHVSEIFSRAVKKAHGTGAELNKDFLISEGMSEGTAEAFLATRSLASLNVLVGEQKNIEIGDFLPDESFTKGIDAREIRADFREKVAKIANDDLTTREAEVLRLRFSDEKISLEKIANRMGVTREVVRQLESKAFKKLREDPRMAELKFHEIRDVDGFFDEESGDMKALRGSRVNDALQKSGGTYSSEEFNKDELAKIISSLMTPEQAADLRAGVRNQVALHKIKHKFSDLENVSDVRNLFAKNPGLLEELEGFAKPNARWQKSLAKTALKNTKNAEKPED